jgi:hypothetical protein
MKIYELVRAEPTLKKISACELPIKTLYGLYRVIRGLDEKLNFYYTTRGRICSRYADEVNGSYVPKPEHKDVFEREMLELLNLDVDMADIKPVVIPADDNLRLSCDNLAAVEEFITIEFKEE